ncbi:hypothetical protein RHMOL_Rhmol13G0006400 [Rhododendron molle]|uniref:Uncharacterized protein n=1 Tax=Rhododendron molle TaxID=49168 RepID=A0ACC0L314_RHOML|nr:hypothetical protein RHMOL_Rhmol13G0006400 [Rhododendron molle]
MGFEMNAALTEKGAAAEFVKPGSIQYPRRKFSAPPAVRQIGSRRIQRPQELDEQLRHSLALIHVLFIVHENCMSPLPKVPGHKVFKVPWSLSRVRTIASEALNRNKYLEKVGLVRIPTLSSLQKA